MTHSTSIRKPYPNQHAEVGLKVNKRNYRRTEEGPEPLEESWWAAVLAEEESYGEPNQHRQSSSNKQEGKPTTPHFPSKPGPIDWEQAQHTYECDEAVTLDVVGYNRGGLLVEGSGLQGFVPISHLVELTIECLDEDRDAQKIASLLAEYMDKTLRLKVIECDPERGRIVFSERAALAAPGRRTQLLDQLKPGDCVHGVVTNITDFGVFVDLGGVEGLIHVSELSWGRVNHPSDAAEVGQEVQAFVIKVEKDRSRVALSLKRLRSNPWDTVIERYHIGQEVEAVITRVVPFGAFARLEEGLDGLIHISEMSSRGDRINPFSFLKEGQVVQVRVLHIEPSKQRLGLSLVP
jgi:small subunit ribosomal protein S1